MPSVYLSPSVQDFNKTILGESEEFFMNLLVDRMVPYMRSSGISFERNDPYSSLKQVIEQSNRGDYDLHLALHSNASPDELAGMLRGPDIYYYAGSIKGKDAAEIFADNIKNIYPDPALVTVIPNRTLAELRKTKAPAVLIETAYHDNYQDAIWLAENLDGLARELVLAMTEYFSIPFIES